MLVVTGSCLRKTRGGDAGACGKVFVLAKRVAVMQALLVSFCPVRMLAIGNLV